MSKELLVQAFNKMRNSDLWSLRLLKVNRSGDTVSYYVRQISLSPEGKIKLFAMELVEKLLKNNGIQKYMSVDSYTGDVVGKVIYKLEYDNELIRSEYEALMTRLALPDTEGPIGTKRYQAYVYS